MFDDYFHHRFAGQRIFLVIRYFPNVWLGVLGQKIQIVLPIIWVYVISNSVVIVYVALQFDMLHPTLLQ